VIRQMGGRPVRCRFSTSSSNSFAEHYLQATLFWNSQTPIEKASNRLDRIPPP